MKRIHNERIRHIIKQRINNEINEDTAVNNEINIDITVGNEKFKNIKPVIVAIAKLESDYIEEWVKYHLYIGFDYIYLYDNEDVPTYEKLLIKYLDNIKVIHLPGNNYSKGVQYVALDNFINSYMNKDTITHIAHIDIDEFIVLKKHNNIKEFINEYIIGDCAGIGINWRFFGDSGHTAKTSNSVLSRFTKCEKDGNKHVKTLFNKEYFKKFDIHHIEFINGYYTKSIKGNIIKGPFNDLIDLSIIQLNHYKCKTIEEWLITSKRGRATLNTVSYNKVYNPNNNKENVVKYENIQKTFDLFNKNDVEDLHAYNIYLKMNNID